MRVCSVVNCKRKHLAKDLCQMHYLRVWRGNEIGSEFSYKDYTAVNRIANKIRLEESAECWIYTGRLTRKGYAHVRSDEGKMRFAHRIMYESLYGAIPKEKEIDHLCRNRACCNPFHLEAVSHVVNVRRGNTGSNHKDMKRDERGRFVAIEKEII